MAKSEFRLALEEAIEQRHSAVHPWSEAWTSGKLDRRLLGEWVKQHFHYVSHFSEWLGAVYATCPHWDVQHFLLENITEEEGFVGSGDFAPVRHSELLLDFEGEVLLGEGAAFLDERQRAQRRLDALRRIGQVVDQAGLYERVLVPYQE